MSREVPDHLRQVALKVDKLLSLPGVTERWRNRIEEWLEDQNTDRGLDRDGLPKQPDRCPNKYADPLPLTGDLDLTEKYVILAAVRDYATETETKRIVPTEAEDDLEARRLNCPYTIVMGLVAEYTEAEAKRLLDCLDEVKADLGVLADPTAVHSDDYRSVNWFGTSYTFTPTQAACVHVLWENWKRGTPEVGEQTILEDQRVESSQNHVSRVFDKGKHASWGNMIVLGTTKGTVRLAKRE